MLLLGKEVVLLVVSTVLQDSVPAYFLNLVNIRMTRSRKIIQRCFYQGYTNMLFGFDKQFINSLQDIVSVNTVYKNFFDRSVYLNIILSNIIEQNLKYQASSGREVVYSTVYSSIPNISRSDQTSYSNISLF